MERVKGIEPSSQTWEAHVLPLNHTRFECPGLVTGIVWLRNCSMRPACAAGASDHCHRKVRETDRGSVRSTSRSDCAVACIQGSIHRLRAFRLPAAGPSDTVLDPEGVSRCAPAPL